MTFVLDSHSYVLYNILSTGVELSCLPVQLIFGPKGGLNILLVSCLTLCHPLPQKAPEYCLIHLPQV